jgi:hypothetical protein
MSLLAAARAAQDWFSMCMLEQVFGFVAYKMTQNGELGDSG